MSIGKQKIAALAITMVILTAIPITAIAEPEPFAELTLRVPGGSILPDYWLYIAKDLRKLGVEVNVQIQESTLFVGQLLRTHDYDMFIYFNSDTTESPTLSWITNPSSSNPFGLNESSYYAQKAEIVLNESNYEMDFDKRKIYLDQWQDIAMDKILYMLPLFASQRYTVNWINLKNYNASWSIYKNLPKLEWEGLHENQNNNEELNLACSWIELNPLFSNDSESKNVIDLLMMNLLEVDPSGRPLPTSIIQDWSRIDDSTFKFTIRDDIYWSPSYNISNRNEFSNDLNSEEISQLMMGVEGESSNGMNQKVTIKDVIFTLLAWANTLVSETPNHFDWLSDVYEDPTDENAFIIVIDKNPTTPEMEPYPDFWWKMNISLLPEFFLNSSDVTITNTISGFNMTGLYASIVNTPAWKSFSESAFGCGMFSLDYAIKNKPEDQNRLLTVLKKNPFWCGIDVTDGEEKDLMIDTINLKSYDSEEDLLVAFKQGKLDFFDSYVLGLHEIKMLRNDLRFNVYEHQTNHLTYLGFNLMRPFLGEIDWYRKYGDTGFLTVPGKEEYTTGSAVRKAICYAINREGLNEEINSNEKIIIDSPLLPVYGSMWLKKDLIKYIYDLDAAIEWLDAAGYVTIIRPDDSATIKFYRTIFYIIIGAAGFVVIGGISLYVRDRYRKHKKQRAIQLN